MAHATITSLARHSHEKNPFVAKLEIFQGQRKTRKENYGGKREEGGYFVREESRGALTNLSLFEDAIVLAYWLDRTQFFTVHSSLGTLNFLPSRPTTFDTFAKMIHWELWEWRMILYWIKSTVGVRNNDTIFKHYNKRFSTFCIKRILRVYIFIFFLKFMQKKYDIVYLYLFMLLHFTIRILGILWDFYMFSFFIPAFSRLLWNI